MLVIVGGIAALAIGIILVRSAAFESYNVVLSKKGEASKPALDEALDDGTVLRSTEAKLYTGLALALGGLLATVVAIFT